MKLKVGDLVRHRFYPKLYPTIGIVVKIMVGEAQVSWGRRDDLGGKRGIEKGFSSNYGLNDLVLVVDKCSK
jgi:hypothetical protein